MPKLILLMNPTTTKQVALRTPDTTIGRASTNDIALEDEQASRFHAVFTIDGPFVSLKDLGSRNGVFVNGQKIETQILANGDEITIGSCKMRFLADDQEFTAIEALRLMTIPGMLVDLDALAPPAARRPQINS
jgi:predicted component of type VI protein secretion system